MEYKVKKYDITEDDIIAGKYNPMDLIAPLWCAVSIDGKEQYEADLARFTSSQRKIFAVKRLNAEVCDGGFGKFLFNSVGIVWEDALAGFRLIGADRCAEILERVIEKFGGSIPFDCEERREMLEKLMVNPDNKGEYTNIFRSDDRYYFEVYEEIDGLIMEYAKTHADEFVFSGEVEVP
ncbi:MAG: DMP19 family protein [Ruminococcus flavefaciens]|nr:DMP19 family protein [Ruminococcus flavefaciens]